jgi:protein involved in polysaccharide export with SLBB domain
MTTQEVFILKRARGAACCSVRRRPFATVFDTLVLLTSFSIMPRTSQLQVFAMGSAVRRVLRTLSLPVLLLVGSVGCETDSYMEPSVTGYYETTPTTIPVLERIDVIEPPEEPLGVTGPPEPQDLIANTLKYRLAAGDIVQVEIYELITQGKTEAAVRVVDAGGFIRLPTINEVQAAGLTLDELREEIRRKLEPFIKNPVVTVDIQEGRSFEYAIQGAIQNSGVFALTKPNFRLTQAIALAGGADVICERVLVVRSMAVENATEREADGVLNVEGGGSSGTSGSTSQPAAQQSASASQPAAKPAATQANPVDIEALINQLSETDGATKPAGNTPAPPTTPPPAPKTDAGKSASPGAVGTSQSSPPVDVDTLEPVTVAERPGVNPSNATQRKPAAQLANEGDSFIFDVNSQQWVRIRGTNAAKQAGSDAAAKSSGASTPTSTALETASKTDAADAGDASKDTDPRLLFKTRIIEVDYDRLVRGDPSQNVVVRPGDDIYLTFPPIGVVYIDGKIQRPGVFQLPNYGRLTLSRLVAAAGGLTEIAIPERVDLVRRLPGGREAAIRVNLAAIRNMAEPDIILKKDDHVIIGTNFWATPLAVFRNGLRMTYGFGFLLDRNFGNDVFGAPPVNFAGN